LQSRFVYVSLLVTSLAVTFSTAAVADDGDASLTTRPGAAALLPHERDEPLRLLALVGPAVAISLLTVLGLTISLRGLRHDLRQRRIVYRQRSH
jgi:hypothetical protein